jgi:hypothetical protein
MVRSVKPQLIASQELGTSERASLALFLGELQAHPDVMAAVLQRYNTASQVIEEVKGLAEDESENAGILRATAKMFESGVDRKVTSDHFTQDLAKSAIKAARQEEGKVNRDRARMINVATFVGEIATWNEYYGVVADVAQDYGVISTDAAPALRLISSEPPAPGSPPEDPVVFAVPGPVIVA